VTARNKKKKKKIQKRLCFKGEHTSNSALTQKFPKNPNPKSGVGEEKGSTWDKGGGGEKARRDHEWIRLLH